MLAVRGLLEAEPEAKVNARAALEVVADVDVESNQRCLHVHADSDAVMKPLPA